MDLEAPLSLSRGCSPLECLEAVRDVVLAAEVEVVGPTHCQKSVTSIPGNPKNTRNTAGVWQRDSECIASISLNFYKDLYSVSSDASTQDSNWWDQLQLPSLSSAQQQLLMAPFSAQEIQSAIFGIDDNKSPGPDGFSSAFFKAHWSDVGRLRLILPSLVADYQNVFVPGRLLSDNALIAHEVSPTACDNLMALLTEFCGLSGQVINLQKSFVKFSPNTPEDYRDYLSSSLKLHCKPSLGSYLGLPVEFGRSKVDDFGFLIDKVVKRQSDFADVGLSSTAKLVIINSILVASFNHILSVFKVPPSICSRIDNLLARFWWKSDSQSRGLAMRSKSLLRPKGLGGLGIRQLESFNSALLTRQCWRIHQHPQLLVSRLLTAKYPSLRSFKTRTIPRSSWGCRSLLTGLSTLDRGIARKAGLGSKVRILEDDWVPRGPVVFRDGSGVSDPLTHVSSIINPRSYAWDSTLVHRLFYTSTALRIMALDRPLQPMDDFVYWKFSKNGSFTTKFAYAMLLRHSVSSRLRGILIDPTCVFCYQERETTCHLFRDCSFTYHLWASAPIAFSSPLLHGKPFTDWFIDTDWISKSVLAQGFRSLVRSLRNSSLTSSTASDSCYIQGDFSSTFDVCLLFDGAWNAQNLSAGAGWIFREVFSDSVLGGGSRACHSSSALQSELQACLWALRAAGRRGFRRLLIYSDFSNHFSLLRDGGDGDISCHWLLYEIRFSVLQFSICKLRKVPHQWVAVVDNYLVGPSSFSVYFLF
ncbi:uncharacterized protein LOC110735439 [Chenopodium quinoa]|uniref:uncharacterized protein LOC110735439 n=1 Tax=Chenopodium quinoa TaxID=63459 RepID=UPI000B79A93A|nr:uncharacterized protein LOC110735439 [Chenopodium quinoa]